MYVKIKTAYKVVLLKKDNACRSWLTGWLWRVGRVVHNLVAGQIIPQPQSSFSNRLMCCFHFLAMYTYRQWWLNVVQKTYFGPAWFYHISWFLKKKISHIFFWGVRWVSCLAVLRVDGSSLLTASQWCDCLNSPYA